MANDLGETIVNMTRNLDKIVTEGVLTSDLNMNGDLLGQFTGVGKIKVPKIDMDGLADYSRKDGYSAGSVDLDWEERQLRYDRGRGFDIDIMDDEEHMMLVSANLMGEFARTRVIPEVDATRFQELYNNAGKAVESKWEDGEGLVNAVLNAETDFEDAGNQLSGAIFYCTSAIKNVLRSVMPYRMGMGEAPNMRFETFDDMRIKVIPSARFYTKIELLSDTETSKGARSAGYKKAEDGKNIDFMIVDPSCAQAITKHETLRYFSPEIYQKMNAHHWDYRLFHDLLVLDYRKAGIYASYGAEKALGAAVKLANVAATANVVTTGEADTKGEATSTAKK